MQHQVGLGASVQQENTVLGVLRPDGDDLPDVLQQPRAHDQLEAPVVCDNPGANVDKQVSTVGC